MTRITASASSLSSVTRISGTRPAAAPVSCSVSIASPAFLIRLVSAWPIIVASRSMARGARGMSVTKRTPGWPFSCKSTAPRSSAARSVSRRSGSGIRAKRENSSTIRRRSLVWRTITSVYCSRSSGSRTWAANLRLMRSADSWIGVSGFLISCAMRRATSPQAAMRCALTRSVTSSKATT